jgi:hypothetical protein
MGAGTNNADNFFCYTGPGVNVTRGGWAVGRIEMGGGGGASSAVPADNPTIYAADNFQRSGSIVGTSTDGDGSLGACPYTVVLGGWTANAANSAVNCTSISSGWGVLGFETGISDGELYFLAGTIGSGYAGVAFRIVDSQNFLCALNTGGGGAKIIQKVVAGVATTIGSGTTGSTDLGRIVFNGDHLQYFNQGETSATIDIHDSTFQTATIHGYATQFTGSPIMRGVVFTSPR